MATLDNEQATRARRCVATWHSLRTGGPVRRLTRSQCAAILPEVLDDLRDLAVDLGTDTDPRTADADERVATEYFANDVG